MSIRQNASTRASEAADADIVVGDTFRVVQPTPTHSPSSIAFGKGFVTTEPGSAQHLVLVVDDIDAAREDLISRGVDVSEVFHSDPQTHAPIPGPDPQRRSYQTYASFSDPRWQRVGVAGDQDAKAAGAGVGRGLNSASAIADAHQDTHRGGRRIGKTAPLEAVLSLPPPACRPRARCRSHRCAVRYAVTSRTSWSVCVAACTRAEGERSAPVP